MVQDLNDSDFTGSKLEGCRFYHSDLRRAKFRDCALSRSMLDQTFLDGADFRGAVLSGASLAKATSGWSGHSGVNFESTDLRKADFREAVLPRAKFDDAVI